MRIKAVIQFSSTPIAKALMAGLAAILGILVYGRIPLHRDQGAFLVWIREDGLVEWITFAQLLILSIFSFIMMLVQPHLGLANKAAELRELSSCFIFLLIRVHPYNQTVFPLEGIAPGNRKASPGE